MSQDRSTQSPAPIAACRLDLAGLRRQRERYRSLAAHVTAIDRSDGALDVRFEPGFDSRLLEETIAVERDCCPFFRLAYDPAERRLRAAVERAGQEPALEALAYALTA